MTNRPAQKNTGPFLAFNDVFFDKYLRLLLWLLNAPVIKVWSRWILRIRRSDCSLSIRISDIHANRFSFGDRLVRKNGRWHLVRTTDFRTHPKFGKRIYYAFRPVWWTLHFWDWLVADRMAPQWSFGFDTLTAYPDPDPETSTVDGFVDAYSAARSWTDSIAATSGTADSTSQAMALYRNTYINANEFELQRGFFLFDTSGIDDAATISAVVISFAASGGATTNADSIALKVVASAPASNTTLADTDFANISDVWFASLAASSWVSTANTYNDLTLDANGRANVSKTGISKFGTRGSLDTSGGADPTGENSVAARTADRAGTSTDPKLVVTYSTTVDVTVEPSAQALTASLPAYSVSGSALVSAVVQALTAVFNPATFSNVTNVIVTASAQALTSTINVVSASGSAVISASVHALIFSTNALSFILDVVIGATVQTLTASTNAVRLVTNRFRPEAKNTTTFTPLTKASTTITPVTKNTTTFAHETKHEVESEL